MCAPIVFVGYWPAQNAVVVAHEGTDPTELYVYCPSVLCPPMLTCLCSLSVLTDIEFVMDQPDPSLFPGIPSSVWVHGGFLSEHAQTAPTILAETKRLISTKGAQQVILVRSLPFAAGNCADCS